MAGLRKVTITVPTSYGVTTGQNLLVFPTSATPTGYAVHDVIATGSDTIQITVTVPSISLLGSWSITARLVKINT